MKIVLGTDEQNHHEIALRLIERLRFPDRQYHLVHVVEPVLPIPADIGITVYEQQWNDYIDDLRTLGAELNGRVIAELAAKGQEARSAVVAGSIPGELASYADSVSADLIAVGSSPKKPLTQFLTGSAGRALVIGANHSVLVARDGGMVASQEGAPIRAVLATDHSDYANQCIDELIRLAPQGLEYLAVLTAYPRERLKMMATVMTDGAARGTEVAAAVESRLREKNEAVTARLHEALNCPVESWIVGQPVREAIAETMAAANAELCIVGAPGHGLLDRLTMGSVSFYEAVAEPWPTLVLRVPQRVSEKRQEALASASGSTVAPQSV